MTQQHSQIDHYDTARRGGPNAAGNQALTLSRAKTAPGREVSDLYYSIASLKLQDDPMVLQFVASRPGEGASLVAAQFAAFAAQLNSGSALLVDCTAAIRPLPQASGDASAATGLVEAFLEDGRLDRAINVGAADAPHVAVLSGRMSRLLHHRGNTLADLLDLARKRYALVVLDTPSLEESASTLIYPRACDGVVLVLEAEATPVSAAESTVEAIERSGGKVLGIVFNKRRLHMPRWLFRRL